MSYTVLHEFPTTGEWGSTTVATLTEAEAWFECKTKTQPGIQRVVTMVDSAGTTIKTHCG